MLTVPARQRVHLSRAERWTVAAAAFMLLFVLRLGALFALDLFKILGISLGVMVVVAAYRRPFTTARFLMIWLPLSTIILAAIKSLAGVPYPLIKNATYLRFLLVAALLAAAHRARKERGAPLDAMDRLAIGYMTIVGVYFVVTPFLAGYNLLIATRMQGLQSLTLFVMVFVAIRWLDFSPAQRESLRKWAYSVIMVIGLFGLYQKFDPAGMRTLVIERFDLPGYYREVSQLSGRGLNDVIQWYWLENPLRVPSLMLAPFEFADIMLVGFAFGLEGLIRRFHPKDVALVAVCGLGIFISTVRIDMIAAGVMILIAGLIKASSEVAKVRFLALAVVLAAAMMPLVLSSRLVQGDSNSDQGHNNEITGSWQAIVDNPIGIGVGNDGAYLRRVSSDRAQVSGNTVLGIGVQVGAVGMVVFVGFLIAVLLALRLGVSHSPPTNIVLGRLILLGGLVTSITHNAWTSVSTGSFSWTFIALGCSAAVGYGRSQPRRLDEYAAGNRL